MPEGHDVLTVARLPVAPLGHAFSSPCGSRTQPARLERPMTSPEVERAVFGAHTERQMGRAVLESASAAFQAAADQPSVGARISATDPTKKARCRCDTGL